MPGDLEKDETQQQIAETQQTSVMGFPQEAFDGETHVGLAIDLEASGKISTLTIPDVNGVGSGTSPVFITKPIAIEGENLSKFLTAKKINIPDSLESLIGTTNITLGGFYYKGKKADENAPEEQSDAKKHGILLFSFEVQFTEGVLGALIDKDISNLFDVKAGYVRVLDCAKADFPVLEQYVKELAAA